MAVYIWQDYTHAQTPIEKMCEHITKKMGDITQLVVLEEEVVSSGADKGRTRATKVAIVYTHMEGQ